ncbi:hypothetical protein DFH09DRAFT_1113058 [Mycena vulgaris]|nr:hypothetical protein DFH09DRAFT_1113058 [Mycena vulgaris]
MITASLSLWPISVPFLLLLFRRYSSSSACFPRSQFDIQINTLGASYARLGKQGLPTIAVFTGVTGAVNGRTSRTAKAFAEKMEGPETGRENLPSVPSKFNR